MALEQLERLRARVEGWFPERHLYIRQGGDMRAFVLSQRKQMMMAGGVAAAALWMGVCTAAMLLTLIQGSAADRQAAQAQAKYERWIADRQARLESAASAVKLGAGSPAALASLVERRHAALALLLVDARNAPGAAQALSPPIAQAVSAATDAADPVHRLQAVQASQEQVLEAADAFAHSRAERVRRALRLAGVSPAAALRQQASLRGPLGGPLIEANDPQALAAVLDADPAFARRIQRAAADLSDAQALSDAAKRLPHARPTQATPQTSGFGMRIDPFTHHSAFHTGLDFAGARMTPVQATAPGLVTFTGVRSGYGKTVEVDHGGGFKTRYAHLASIGVRPGQRVAVGARLGGMGSTGRSTGTHLHYEVWVNGRVQNPERFVRAGAYALQGG
ncbi:M23 family metallopeptidase [Phenylobacterium sp. LjRoot225]|uniref:M23 family metallopeptidase n=1 Tax=Phenylobacterium sp. LjRoot225 TaxID=3342285 RepID=UPI003ED08322